MNAAPERDPIQYSRGRDRFDAYPEQLTAVSFEAFRDSVLGDRARAKGLTWISAPFAQNGDGRRHRCREGALPRAFLAFDLDGGTEEGFVGLSMLLWAYSGFGYTTASHTAASPHARYILELSRPVDRVEGIRLGMAMQRQIEARQGPGTLKFDDSVYRGEQPVFAPLIGAETMSYHGDPVDVDQILKDAPPLKERPGRAARAAGIASRDPVVHVLAHRKLIKRDHGDGKLSIICPFENSHTEPGGESSTVYFLPNFGGVSYGTFVCMHRHCDGRQHKDYLMALGLDAKEIRREQAAGAVPPLESYDEDARRHTVGAGAPTGGESGEVEPNHGDTHGEAADTTGCDTPTIQYKAGELPRNLDQAESALLVQGGVYQRGSLLVRVARIPEARVTRSVRRHGGALTIIPLDKATLVELLTSAARWETLDKKTKEHRAINCPKTIAEGLLARAGNWRFPVLAGIAEAPYMMEGHIYDAPGYEPRTGAYLNSRDKGFSEIPRNPTPVEAQKALRILKEVVKDFPFVAEVDVSVWISALLTTFVRLALRSAPLFGITATVMATGKSLLADLISIIATGRRASVMSHVRDHNEEKKRLLSILMEGDPIITVDNIGEPWGSDSMAAILTAETYKDRLLGVNSVITVPTTATWIATGNNLTFCGDLSTRVLVARLDPRCERPEDRSFDRDLLAWVPEHRAELVAACLTILASYVASGYPDVGLRPFGRFEDWSRLVRAALVWLGEPDPCKARAHIEGSDPIKQSLGAMLAAWWATFKDTPKTVGQADKSGGDELRDALLIVSGDKERINLRKAGNWLAKYEGRVVDGLRFQRAGTYQRSVLWCVASVESCEFNEFCESSHRHARENQGGDSIFNGRDRTHETPETHKEANGAGGDAQSMAEIRGWLQRLGEDPETISEVLESCARDPAVMSGYLRSAREVPS